MSSSKSVSTSLVDRHEAEGVFSADAIAQARGLAPRARNAQLHPADGREPAHARSRESQGPAQENLDGPDDAKAAGAQARSIEADQARLRDQSVGERYQAALQTYLLANTQRIDRIENRLETLIENQQATLGELAAQRPSFFSSATAKAQWAAGMEASQDRLQVLRGRLSQLEETKEQSEELAEEKMREREPELTRAVGMPPGGPNGVDRKNSAKPPNRSGRNAEAASRDANSKGTSSRKMRTTVQIAGTQTRVTFEKATWSCDDPDLSQLIATVLAGEQNSPSIPDWDYHQACLVCEFFGGEIVAYAGPPKTVPGRIY